MPRKTRTERRTEELLNENLPIDVLPYSNGEFIPPEPSEQQLKIMQIANEAIEEARRKYGLDRRTFVRTSAAFTICLWAINKVASGKNGHLAFGGQLPHVSDNPRWDACDLNNPEVQLDNLPGEFVLDVQTHHVTSNHVWRATLPYHHAFICGLFGVTSGNMTSTTGENDPCEAVGRWSYFKNIYLDSSTTAGVLSPVPAAPDWQNPLPFKEADTTANMIENATGSERCVTHGYIAPNRGRMLRPERAAAGSPGVPDAVTGGRPVFLDDEMAWIRERSWKYRRHLRGWKSYVASGDVPLVSGCFLDEPWQHELHQTIREVGDEYGIPKVYANHKGIQLPSQDSRANATDDVPAMALAFPDITYVLYHSAGGGNAPYPTDVGESEDSVKITDNNTNALIKNLRGAGLDAQNHVPAGLVHGNTPNVAVDLGSVTSPGNPDGAAAFLAKMIWHIGPRRLCHGTDAIWGGSPHDIIVLYRTVQMSDEIKDLYQLPHGFEGDRFDPRVDATSGADYTQAYLDAHPSLQDAAIGGNWPTDGKPHPERTIRNGILGRNAADIYQVDADAMYAELSCDRLNEMRAAFTTDMAGLGKYAPTENMIYGPRTRQELVSTLNEGWKENGWHI